MTELSWDAATASRHDNQIPATVGFTTVNVDLQKSGPVLTLRMPDGKIVRTSEITLELLWPYKSLADIAGTSTFEKRIPPAAVHGRTLLSIFFESTGACSCSFMSAYLNGSYTFEFQDAHLIKVAVEGFSSSCPEHCRPGIGNADGTLMYSMPMTEEALITLFGPLRNKREFWGGL